MSDKQYPNRVRKQLIEKINELSFAEHEEIFKIIRDHIPDCNYTQNSNGIFCNMSAFPDELMRKIETFVVFCTKNKKQLDDYDQKMKECKMKNNLVFSSASQQHIDDSNGEAFPPSVNDDNVKAFPCEKDSYDNSPFHRLWGRLLESDPHSKAIANHIYACDRVAKKKMYTKFHAAKKRFSKRVPMEKRSDAEFLHDLIRE